MRTHGWLGCAIVVLILGCNGKLKIDDQPSAGAAGVTGGSGTGGSDTGGSGTGGSGTGGHVFWDGGSAGRGKPDGATGGGDNIGGRAPFGGGLGQPCIPGSVTSEAVGTEAETEIRTLERCNEGLYCNAQEQCVKTLSCGEGLGSHCVVYQASGAGGTGGLGALATGGTLNTGGTLTIGGAASGTVLDRPPVRALAASESHLYFTDYGTRDQLGNHHKDGALMAYSFSDNSMQALATDLAGPTSLGVTDQHAYFVTDGAGLVGSDAKFKLLRVALAGGKPELVQDGARIGVGEYSADRFTHRAAQAFWSNDFGIFSQAPDPGATPAQLLDKPSSYLTADQDYLYYYLNNSGSVWRIPFLDGSPEEVALRPNAFAVNGESLYYVETLRNGTAMVLARSAKDREEWKRIRALGSGGGVSRLDFVGDRFFVQAHPPESGPFVQQDLWKLIVLTGVLGSEGPSVRVLERTARNNPVDELWVGTDDGLFWSDGAAVYWRALEP